MLITRRGPRSWNSTRRSVDISRSRSFSHARPSSPAANSPCFEAVLVAARERHVQYGSNRVEKCPEHSRALSPADDELRTLLRTPPKNHVIEKLELERLDFSRVRRTHRGLLRSVLSDRTICRQNIAVEEGEIGHGEPGNSFLWLETPLGWLGKSNSLDRLVTTFVAFVIIVGFVVERVRTFLSRASRKFPHRINITVPGALICKHGKYGFLIGSSRCRHLAT
ncbi:hypothetical protein NL676_013165 [Syzygium grande]|nr:hypothetical protein NL676_013165 [Syzygium grande]